MHRFSLAFDASVATCLYLAILTYIFVWRHNPPTTRLKLAATSLPLISLRLGIVVFFLTAVCYVVDCTLLVSLALFASLFLLAGLGSFIGAPALLLAYLMQQLVLGFPDRSEWILKPSPPTKAATPETSPCEQYIGRRGITSTVLKPVGEIYLDGDRLAATSESGELIDRSRPVVVSGARRDMLFVREANLDSI